MMVSEFVSWCPAGIKPKAVIVLVPPSNADGRSSVYGADWQQFAKAHGVALVGCYFQDDDPSWIEQYCDMKHGAGSELRLFIQTTFKESLPLLLWGFSAGGQFNYEFTCAFPYQVAGFVVNKGGVYYTALANEAARNVPGLFIMGARDAQFRKSIIRGIFDLNSEAGAKWELLEDQCGHMTGKSEEWARSFFANILRRMK